MSYETETAGSALRRAGFHTTLFSGGRTLHRGPAVMLRNAFKVELGRTNRVKYSDDNNPLSHTCAGGQSLITSEWYTKETLQEEARPGWRRCAAPPCPALTGPSVCRASICQLIISYDLEYWPQGSAASAAGTPNTEESASAVVTQEPREHTWRGVCTPSYTHRDFLSRSIVTLMAVFIQTQEPLVQYSGTLHVIRESAFSRCPSTTINMI